MDEIPFQIRAILGQVTLSKEDFTQLQRGDIVLLDQRLEDPLRVEIGENGHLLGYAGVKEGQKAIKIEKIR
jgi:flagellar motor switch protein FliM